MALTTMGIEIIITKHVNMPAAIDISLSYGGSTFTKTAVDVILEETNNINFDIDHP